MWAHLEIFLLACILLSAAVVAATVLTPVALSTDVLSHYTFEKYLADFGKQYVNPAEYVRRSFIFSKNMEKIIAFNNYAPGRSYRLGVNRFSDLTDEEFAGKFLGLAAGRPSVRLGEKKYFKSNELLLDVPESMNWQDAKPPVLTPVKDQGGCGSCWALAAAESLESMHAIHEGVLLTLSTQQITSCTENPNKCGGAGGCEGGTVQLAWESLKSHGGIVLNEDYPYESGTSHSTETCALNNSMKRVVKVYGYVSLARNDYDAVMEALVKKGPLAVSVAANQWRDYAGGVFDGCSVGGENITINHAVQLVGYGTDNQTNQDYWIVRNSWGESWGENGYIRLLRKKVNETCAFVDKWNTDGGGCANDKNETLVACGMCGVLFDGAYPVVVKPPQHAKYVWIVWALFVFFCVLMILLMIWLMYFRHRSKNNV